MDNIRFGAAMLLCVAVVIGCGTRQPLEVVNPPKPVLPAKSACTGVRVGENVQVTLALGESNDPDIVWEEKRFRIAWWDMRNQLAAVYHLGMDQNGYEVSPPAKIENIGPAKEQTLAFDGIETHVVWAENNRILSTRLNGSPAKRVVLSETGAQPAAGPWGSAVWVDSGRVFFRCDGMRPGLNGEVEPLPVAAGGVENPRIAYNGIFFAVVWSSSAPGGRDIMLQRVSPQGKILGEPVKVSFVPGIARGAAIAWDGENFAVTWTQKVGNGENPTDVYQLYFAVVPQVGNRSTVAVALDLRGSLDQVAITGTGEEYAVVWVGSLEQAGNAVYFQRIGKDGKLRGKTHKVSDGVPLSCSKPAMAWDGSGFAVVWHDDRARVDSEVYFSYLKCTAEEEETATLRSQDNPDEGAGEGPPDDENAPGLKEVF